ncbi:carboxypeptidase M32 [Erwinia psidii]|uniref:Metal-dependent carboxypeptidase n=1 Tax=Erwinia psidii TaxID=69224 RepID=A0A3N6SFP8_9GAMM|nr:carboxypeptidase M32 [Erwinia psidii]MCX8956015.1 carboxypeptidase M32 [Erwinia psidii]MCX8961389.1 carboxypeptidase M32 [Erwinia psidii]MCX8963765.1 carboxypeptidase M32 [Erwinia psidii]RQM38723.1 carboxypeptidase M32 [Erwinia psidii]
MSSAYTNLTQVFTRLSRFDHLAAITGWDMMTMMPPGGSQARGAALAELSVLKHEILTGKDVAQWLKEAEQQTLNDVERANLSEMQRSWKQASLLPASLVEARSVAGSRCEHAWRQQRPANDWQGFSANLKEVVRLSRQEAEIRSQAQGCSRYDALLDLYEPGMTSARLDQIFGEIKQWLPSLLERIVDRQAKEKVEVAAGPFALDSQKQLGLAVMKLLDFDFNAGRLDVSAHPFCGGVPEDVRITTRYNENEFISAMMGVIHETGHARYEQNLPKQWAGQPVGLARSTAVHESQSLFFEKQLGRNTDFLTLMLPHVRQLFGDQPALEQHNFIALNQRVKPGLIRVDADEVSYPAHVILRYEIEKELISGEIEVDDIPGLWQQKMQSLLGIDTSDNYRDGCMQDIHWTDGSFGYFPTYTLGAMYAAQLFHAVNKALPDVGQMLRQGNLQPIFNWLKQNIWQHGSRFSTRQLIENATGEDLNPLYFKKHLENRYLNGR